jgi:hypothetical protein
MLSFLNFSTSKGSIVIVPSLCIKLKSYEMHFAYDQFCSFDNRSLLCNFRKILYKLQIGNNSQLLRHIKLFILISKCQTKKDLFPVRDKNTKILKRQINFFYERN